MKTRNEALCDLVSALTDAARNKLLDEMAEFVSPGVIMAFCDAVVALQKRELGFSPK
jgi:hypothetical protein